MEKIEIVKKFKTAHDAYFKLLVENYPTKSPVTEDSRFGKLTSMRARNRGAGMSHRIRIKRSEPYDQARF